MVKFKCKQCNHKFKVHKRADVTCDKNNCEIKYNMSGEALNFQGFDPLRGETPTYLSSYTTPKPVTINTEFSEAEWEAYMAANGYQFRNGMYE